MHYYRHVDAPTKVGNGAATMGGASFGSGIGEIPHGSLEALRAQGLGGMDMALGDSSNYLQALLPAAGQILQKGIPTSQEDIAALTQNVVTSAGAAGITEMKPDDRFALLRSLPEPARNELLKKLPKHLQQEYLARLNPQERAAVGLKLGITPRSDVLKWALIAGGVGIGAIVLLKLMGGKKSRRSIEEA